MLRNPAGRHSLFSRSRADKGAPDPGRDAKAPSVSDGSPDAVLLPRVVAGDLHAFEALYRIYRAIAENADPAQRDLATLNIALAAAPARSQLERIDGAYVWALPDLKLEVASLLAPVIWALRLGVARAWSI